MDTPKTRTGSSEAPKKTSPRVVRQLKVSSVAFGSSNPASPSGTAARTPKDRSPKVPERRSPRSPLVSEKKRASRVSELEGQISELRDDLKKVNEQLTASKASKEEAEAGAEGLKEQLAAVTSKFEESQRRLSDLCASREAHVAELKGVSEEKDQAWEAQLEITRKQHSIDAASLASALDEIETLKKQLEMVSRCESDDERSRDSSDFEIRGLRENLGETLMVLESMKNEMMNCKESEAQAQDLANETLIQLEVAKQTVSALRDDGAKAMEAYGSVALELENSKARVALLEGVVNKLKVDLAESNDNAFQNRGSDEEDEVVNLRSEVAELKSALEAADFRRHDEEAKTSAQIKSTHESADEIASESSAKQAELVEELKLAKSAIDELKANLVDKENELQGISGENESLILKLQESKSEHNENKLEDELNRLKDEVANLKSNLMDRETELQIIVEENKTLKSEVASRVSGPMVEEAEAAEQEDALMKLEVMKEEAEKSKRRAARAGEQLEAAQAANGELEAELRRLKVQSDQWRKAAEAAASMLSSSGGNGRLMERTGSLDNSNNGYSSPYMDDYDDEDAFKKKNGNVLRKIGGFWKKPQK